MKQMIMAIDVGSMSVSCVIAEVNGGIPKILSYGTSKTKRMIKKTAVPSLEQTAQSIKEAVIEAKRIVGSHPDKAIISTSGIPVKSYDGCGVVVPERGEIGTEEIKRVVHGALYNAKISPEYEVVHVLPYQFIIDGEQVEDPNGMTGNNLKAMVHIVTAQKTVLENLRRAVKIAGIEVESVVLSSYASAIATLSEDEKEMGVACIDIGGNWSDIMIYNGNSMCYNDVIRVGSHYVTNDIAVIFSTLPAYAEAIKVSHLDIACRSDEDSAFEIETSDHQSKKVTLKVNKKDLAEVACYRLKEIFSFVAQKLEESGCKDQIGAGLVFTGGLMKINAIEEFIQAMFKDQAVRIALPRELEGMPEELKDYTYSTVIGLILYASGNFTNYEIDGKQRLKIKKSEFTQNCLFGEAQKEDELKLDDEVFKEERVELSQIKGDRPKQEGFFDKLKTRFENLF